MDKLEAIEEIQTISDNYGLQWEENLAEELEGCVDSEFENASIILGWSLFIREIYNKIEEYGLSDFGIKAETKGFTSKNIQEKEDLNNIKDIKVIELSDELGIMPPQLRDDAEWALRKRNNCAHYGQKIPDMAEVTSFFNQLLPIIRSIRARKFEDRRPGKLEKLRNLGYGQIKSGMPIEQGISRNIIASIKREIYPLDMFDYQENINYFNYLEIVIKHSDDKKSQKEATITILDLLMDQERIKDLHTETVQILKDSAVKASNQQFFKEFCKEKEVRDQVIDLFGQSFDNEEAKKRSKWIKNLSSVLEEDDWELIVRKITQNSALFQSKEASQKLETKLYRNREKIKQGTWETLTDELEFI